MNLRPSGYEPEFSRSFANTYDFFRLRCCFAAIFWRCFSHFSNSIAAFSATDSLRFTWLGMAVGSPLNFPRQIRLGLSPSHDETPGTGGSTPHTFARCAGNSAAVGRLPSPDRTAWPWGWPPPAPGGILPPLEVPYCARFALKLVLDKEHTAISTGTKIKRYAANLPHNNNVRPLHTSCQSISTK